MKRSPIPYAPSVFAYWKCSDTVGDKDLEKKLVIDGFHPDLKLNLHRSREMFVVGYSGGGRHCRLGGAE